MGGRHGVAGAGLGVAVWSLALFPVGGAVRQDIFRPDPAEGAGVPQDDAEAVRWYRLAAEQVAEARSLYLDRLATHAPRAASETILVPTGPR